MFSAHELDKEVRCHCPPQSRAHEFQVKGEADR